MNRRTVSLRETVGSGYGAFWRWRGRYRAVKGGRASKKSCTTALWLIVNIMRMRGANALVVRRTYRSLRDSCYAQLRWAIHRLRADAWWSARENPLELVYRPTGQRIVFRGLDDPLKVSSIAVETGSLCWLWVEEAYEIARESDFDTLDEAIRGEVAPPLFKQTTLTFNPWSGRHWLKGRFFDRKSPDVLAMTTDYRCNEWLDDADRAMFRRMERENPRRYRVAGLGEWGMAEGLVYDDWEVAPFDVRELLTGEGGEEIRCVYGLDYGYSNDPTAFIAAAADGRRRRLYIFDEFVGARMVNSEIARMIVRKGYQKERIRADSAEPKSNEELRRLGISRITPAPKGRDSVLYGISALREYHMVVHPRCRNTIAELASYAWETQRDGTGVNRPADRDNHLMDALRYAMADAKRGCRAEQWSAGLFESGITARDLLGSRT